MKKLCLYIVFLICSMCICYMQVYSEASEARIHLFYEEETEGKKEDYECIITTTANGYIINELYSDGSAFAVTDETFNTVKSETTDNKTGRSLVCVKEGGFLKATYCGITRTVKTKGLPWHQSAHQLRNFILSEEKYRKYWIVPGNVFERKIKKAKDIMVLRFIVKNRKNVVFDFNGRKVEAVRVKITLDDFRSVFWKSRCWFRKSDGILLRSEEPRGPPGTPVTTGILVKEKYIP